MNKFIDAVKQLDLAAVKVLLKEKPQLVAWAENDGKNALHYLCGVAIDKHPGKADESLLLLKLLLKSGMDINAVHKIPDPNCGFFPATPLWYAYTRGRNEKLYTYLLKNGANPQRCMFAIAWYDDAKAAALFKKYGAAIDDGNGGDTPFIAAYNWNKLKVAEWFLKNGANVNFADAKGNTALYYAVKKKHKPEQIKMLLHYGANPGIENNEGISPKKLAGANRQRTILSFF